MDCNKFYFLCSSIFGLEIYNYFQKRMQSFQNLALATLSILAGILLQNSGYFVLELFFLVLCLSKLWIFMIFFKMLWRFESNTTIIFDSKMMASLFMYSRIIFILKKIYLTYIKLVSFRQFCYILWIEQKVSNLWDFPIFLSN